MKDKKELVKQYILNLIAKNHPQIVAKTLDAFSDDISKSTVYNYLNELCDSGIIKKEKNGYSLVKQISKFKYVNDGTLDEDRVYDNDIAPILSNDKDNVKRAWRYAFTEMMNNAIEHSTSKEIIVMVETTAVYVTMYVSDFGVGIFNNIREFIKKEKGKDLTLKECATLLFAGKFTTAKSRHSGEGIFFTSHLMDSFVILSENVFFSRNNFKDINFDLDVEEGMVGTTVLMRLSRNSKKTTTEIFSRFSNIDEGFIKTQIPIAHVFSDYGPVSRSEARRLTELLHSFKEIELDFSGVEEVGQAFVHELFGVWLKNNPDVEITIINASPDVDFMIKRVKAQLK
ncbi:MAG: DUF4325 domain-containing protein [Clostridia bacterium]|nr:DUF4325 domain-containing protein [Clostridia bacterium]